jgi:hypothetical protein
MTEYSLLDCAHCGASALFDPITAQMGWQVMCSNHGRCGTSSGLWPTKAMAARGWNVRANRAFKGTAMAMQEAEAEIEKIYRRSAARELAKHQAGLTENRHRILPRPDELIGAVFGAGELEFMKVRKMASHIAIPRIFEAMRRASFGPLCLRCGAAVHNPCSTEEAQAKCELPDFCFPEGRTPAVTTRDEKGASK